VAIDLSALSNFTTSAGSLSNLILVTPGGRGYQAQNGRDRDGQLLPLSDKFLFHYEGENSFSVQSDITDHFVEDNSTVNDNIALPPEEYSVSGFIGELNNVTPESLASLKLAAEKLTILAPYTPELSITALNAYNSAFRAYAAARSIVNSAIETWDGVNNQNEQQKAFSKFYAYWKSRTLFTIQTPWAKLEDMAIRSLSANQDAETEEITSFDITFKKIRYAEVVFSVRSGNGSTTTSDNSNFQNRAYDSNYTTKDLGVSTPSESISLTSLLA